MAESNMSEPSVKEFRCFQCKDLLCIPPIVLLSDGNSLCGICSTSIDQTKYRNLMLEKFLKTLSFPCKFKRHGCTAHLRFGETQEHQAKCIHRPRSCPVLPSCSWEGAIQQMCDHFTTDHSDLMADRMEFKLNVRDKDEHELLLAHVNGITGILRYSYSLAFGNLQYDIQHFNTDYEEILLKTSITNDLDSDYKLHVKGGVSPFFNDRFYRDFREDSSSKTLSLNNIFPALNHPDCILVTMDWQVDKSKKVFKGNEETQSVNKSEKQETVNYALIETLKCVICKSYLLPPLYKISRSACMICWYCHNGRSEIEPVLEKHILKKVAKAYFPCRWRGCDVIKVGSNLISHELSCTLRMYNCHICDKNTFTRDGIIVHAKQHGNVYFQDCHTFNIHFVRSESDGYCYWVDYLTFKNNSRVYISCCISFSYCQFKVRSEYRTGSIVVVVVEFEHDHCKIKPAFSIKSPGSLQVSKDDMPTCFKYNQQIKVTLRVSS